MGLSLQVNVSCGWRRRIPGSVKEPRGVVKGVDGRAGGRWSGVTARLVMIIVKSDLFKAFAGCRQR